MEVKDQATAGSLGVNGVVLVVSGLAAGKVAVDYSAFAHAGGGSFGTRVRIVQLPECALTTPEVAACRQQAPLHSLNDVAASMVSVPVGAQAQVPRASAGAADSTAAMTGGAMVLAAVAGSSGSNGDFTATSLRPSGSWTAGGSSGGFTYSYPVSTPQPAAGTGVAPKVGLAYSSASVDGRIASTNNQPSWIGSGWDYQPGFIERTYRTCSTDPNATADSKTSDNCWAGQIVSMSLGGQSTALVLDDTTGTWHPQGDNGQRVELLTGSSNGARNGEYWRITTADGVQYYFGRNNGPGWSGQATTNSTLLEPVYGAHAGDPCYSAAGFAQSSCTQAYRWNLDYVEDPHGNATMYYYSKEQNFYGADGGTTGAPYDRASDLSRIDIGLRDTSGNVYAAPAQAQVGFTVSERCIPDANFSCAPSLFTSANAARWPDTPQDQQCLSGAVCNNHAPTFWTTKRLTSIDTAYYNGTGYNRADNWILNQQFSITGDPQLILTGVVRTGFGATGTTLALPQVTFGYNLFDNRVAGYNAQPPMSMYRLTQITAETGAQTLVTYGQPNRPDGSASRCSSTSVPADPANDTMLCFPVEWVLPYQTQTSLDYFHKYIVTQVQTTDSAGQSPVRITNYAYLGYPAWHADDNETVLPADRTYGEFRGYTGVQTRIGDPNHLSNGSLDQQTLTETDYLRGMGGTITNSLGETITDSNELAGSTYQASTYSSTGGSLLATTLTTTSILATTSTRARTDLPALTATRVAVTRSRTITNLAAGGTTTTSSAYAYDSAGRQIQQTDSGTNVPDLCTTTSYADNTTNWIRNQPAEQIRSAQTCPSYSTPPAPVLSDTRTYYDGSGTLGSLSGPGDATRAAAATTIDGNGNLVFAASTAGYDPAGRVLTTTAYTSPTDTTGRTTTVAYTPATGGPLTTTTTTNPLRQVTSVIVDPHNGVTLSAVDVAAHRTDAAYDPLGRLTSVWKPGQVKGTDPASTTYAYLLRTNGPLAVTTGTLANIGPSQSYVTSVNLYDSYGSLLQTQADAEGAAGNRIVTDTFYDSHGWAIRTNNRWYTTGAPATTLTSTADANVDSRTTTSYDGTGRVTGTAEYKDAAATGSSQTIYGGDRTTTIPLAGGTTQTTVVDARGNTTGIQLYNSAPSVTGSVVSGGAHNDTAYSTDALGRVTGMTDPLGASWAYTYDLAGRQIQQSDPDSGTTTTTYLGTGETASTTDARGTTLIYGYDALGRKTTMSSGGSQLASWTYDTLQTGQPTASTRYTTAGNYTTAALGYDAYGNPTGSTVTIPAVETGLSGTYTTKYTWSKTHLMLSETVPGGGGMIAETLTHTYTRLGNVGSTTGLNSYAPSTTYSPYGEVLQMQVGSNNQTGWLTYYHDAQTRRITGLKLSTQTAAPTVENLTYTYNQAGNVTKTVDQQGDSTVTAAPTETTCYTYDGLQELTAAWSATDNCTATPTSTSKATVGGPQPFFTTWAIDAAGNRTQQTQNQVTGGLATTNTATYAVATPGHAHAVTTSTTTSPATSTSYGYDPAGNTTTRTGRIGGNQTITYTPDGHTNTITTGTSNTSYIYSADGATLIRHDPTSTTLYLGGTQYTRKSTGAFSSIRYITHAGHTIAEWVTANAQNSYLLTDLTGTAVAAAPTTTSGYTTPARRHVDPYGNAQGTPTGTWPTPDGYLNQPNNTTTGLTETGAREYDATIGRFLSVDPVLTPNNPLQNNGYNYTWNSPVSNFDPAGTYPNCSGPDGAGCKMDIPSEPAPASDPPDTSATPPPDTATFTGAGSLTAVTPHFSLDSSDPNSGYVSSQVDKLVQKDGFDFTGPASPTQASQELYVWQQFCQSGEGSFFCGDDATLQQLKDIRYSRAVTGDTGELNQFVVCGGQSFTSDTQVLMADGSTERISKVVTGQVVQTDDQATGTITTDTVDAVWARTEDGLLDVTVTSDGTSSTIHSTEQHPFWDATKNHWVDGRDLQAGDHLLTPDHRQAIVSRLTKRGGTAEMWDITVVHDHNFFITAAATAILVHNCPNPNGRNGGAGHRAAVDKIKQLIGEDGYAAETEKPVRVGAGGWKSLRFADVAAIDRTTGEVVGYYQAGVVTQGGLPVARERRAFYDLQISSRSNVKLVFVPYNQVGDIIPDPFEVVRGGSGVSRR